MIRTGCGEKTIPGGEAVGRDAGRLAEPVKFRSIDIEQSRGLADREDRQLVIDDPLVQKFRHNAGQFILGKILLPVHQIVGAEGGGRTRVAGKKIRHAAGAGLARLGIQKLLSDFGSIGDKGHVDDDSLLLADSFIEFIDQFIHR